MEINMSKSILLVGDIHLDPSVSNERMLWLGRLVGDRKPDIVLQIGDFNDMGSLSSYDKGKKSFEGRRYTKDIENSHKGLQLFEDGLDESNKILRSRKVKTYQPKKYMTWGNHDFKRVMRAINEDSELEGLMSIEDQGFEDFGWETVPFLEPLDVEGIIFQHYFTSGSGMDRPLGGENLGKALLKRYHTSCFQGHNHLLQLANETNGRGERLWGGSVGCYMEHNLDYLSRQAQQNFWRGVVLLKGCKNGSIDDIETISLKTIKTLYR
jgi:hypothetical protein